MIESLDRVLDGPDCPGVTELQELLEDLLGGPEATGRLVEQQALPSTTRIVFRLCFALAGRIRSLVVKCLRPDAAFRNELATRWLSAVGLGDSGPPLLGSVAVRSGGWVWQVYEDLGSHGLDALRPGPEKVRAAAELVARMHTRFREHGLLGEIRLNGGALGVHFYESSVRDAIRALEACSPADGTSQLRDRLLQRLWRLNDQLPERAERLRAFGGPETLLHGDLTASNVFVIPAAAGGQVRLIDWDHAGAGPASYDLSTFLLRFPPGERPWILGAYRQETERAGQRLAPARELNLLFETAEYARCANCVIWPAIALVHDDASWGWDQLAEVDRWFEHFEPVLPGEPESRTMCLVKP